MFGGETRQSRETAGDMASLADRRVRHDAADPRRRQANEGRLSKNAGLMLDSLSRAAGRAHTAGHVKPLSAWIQLWTVCNRAWQLRPSSSGEVRGRCYLLP